MAVAPTAPRIVVGEPWSATKWNLMADAIDFILNPPFFAGRHTSAGTFFNATWTSVELDTEDEDNYNGHSTVSNKARYVSQVAGWYQCFGSLSFATNATGLRGAAFLVNGADRLRKQQFASNSADVQVMSTSGLIYLAVGDYIELQGYQSSGSSLTASAIEQPAMQVQWSRLS